MSQLEWAVLCQSHQRGCSGHLPQPLLFVPSEAHMLQAESQPGHGCEQDLALPCPLWCQLSPLCPAGASLGALVVPLPSSDPRGFSSQLHSCCFWGNSTAWRLPAPQTGLFHASPMKFTASSRLGKTSEIESNL